MKSAFAGHREGARCALHSVVNSEAIAPRLIRLARCRMGSHCKLSVHSDRSVFFNKFRFSYANKQFEQR